MILNLSLTHGIQHSKKEFYMYPVISVELIDYETEDAVKF